VAKRSIKKGMRRMGVDNSKDFKTMQDAAMAAGGPKMIVGDDKMREEKCLAEINRACSAYDCMMIAEMTVGGTDRDFIPGEDTGETAHSAECGLNNRITNNRGKRRLR